MSGEHGPVEHETGADAGADDASASAVQRALARDREGAGRSRLVMWSGSIVLHVVLVVAGFFIVWSVTRAEEPLPEVVDVSFLDPTLGSASIEVRQTSDDSGALELVSEPVELTPAVEVSAEAEAPLAPPRFTDAPPPPRSSPGIRDVIADPEVLIGDAERAVEFAGVAGGNARDVVYVVDASGSMVSGLPIVKRMLTRSLRELAPTQRFCVLFFTGGEFVSWTEEPRLVRASASNLRGVVAWIESVNPRGRSDPIAALKAAIGLRPDVVFVLSKAVEASGVWDPDDQEVLSELDRLNPIVRDGRRRVTIRAIQFLQDDPGGLLRQIGRLHGGADGYELMTREDLRRMR